MRVQLSKEETQTIALAVETLIAKKHGYNIKLDCTTRAGNDWFIHFQIFDKFGRLRNVHTFYGFQVKDIEDIADINAQARQIAIQAKDSLREPIKTVLRDCEAEYGNAYYSMQSTTQNLVASLAEALFPKHS